MGVTLPSSQLLAKRPRVSVSAVGAIYKTDLREVPRYTVPQAAGYLRLPPMTLRQWVRGYRYRTRTGGLQSAPPLIDAADPALLSFHNLVEAYVLAGIRRREQIPLQKVRKALAFVEREMDLKRPLLEKDFYTDGVDLFVDRLGELVSATKEQPRTLQLRFFKDLIRQSLKRIDRDPRGVIARLSPWAQQPGEPHDVEIDPRRAFGKLVIAKTGIPTAIVAERMGAGESIAHLADDYGLPTEKIEAAIRWELQIPAAA